MSVLWAGGEDLSFQNGTLPTILTGSTYSRAGYARCALNVPIAARGEKTSGSPIGTLKLGWKTGGTVNVDAGHSLTTAWACYERLALLNPSYSYELATK